MTDTVAIDSGRLRGRLLADDVRAFSGIPYAAPPVGDLRWRPPQPVAEWSDVREATRFAKPSRQAVLPPDSIYHEFEPEFSEDCLYLNIWTGPSVSGDRPVMVWLHPGGYQFGSANNALYNGAALARDGATVVTVNHRLGRFGFMAHPWLSAESGYGGSGNYGLMDILAALRWINRNIDRFGGDPGNVTVFGVSAGGNSVHNLRAMPQARGLIHRSIAQSGPGVGPVLNGPGHALGPSTLAAGEEAGSEITRMLGVSSMAELRRLPAEAVEGAVLPRAVGDWQFKIFPGARVSTHVFDGGYPVIDGHVLPRSPLDTYLRGEQLDIPLLVGNVSNESCPLPYLTTVDDYRRFLTEEFGSFADEAFTLYPGHTDAEVEVISGIMDADRTFVTSSRTAARMQSSTGSAPVWHYWFDRAPVIPQDRGYIEAGNAGAFHLCEVPYIFQTLDGQGRENWPWSAGDRALSRQISTAWGNFARTGNPNGEGAPEWPIFHPATPSTLVWDLEPYVADPLNHERMEFFDRFNAVWDGRSESVTATSH